MDAADTAERAAKSVTASATRLGSLIAEAVADAAQKVMSGRWTDDEESSPGPAAKPARAKPKAKRSTARKPAAAKKPAARKSAAKPATAAKSRATARKTTRSAGAKRTGGTRKKS
jgi:hypothetical protein